jgi:flagellar L-ring protein precursor FlgH
MSRAVRAVAACAAVAAAAGCADRLDHLGKAPTMTAPGAPKEAVEPIAPARAALARKAPPPPPETYAVGSLWRSGPASLFGDRRARVVGDILTVVIEIDDEATISNRTNRARSGSESASVEALLGLPSVADQVLPGEDTLNPGVELGSSSSTRGQGQVSRAEEIALRIAATVTDVLPNGHLVIYGNQEVRVNFELRDLQVAGVIRPEDISRRNEIPYDKIADARVAYGGRGQITDLQQPRYGQQVLDIVLPF